MAMYDELSCPEEQTTITPTEITTVEFSSTTEESRPEVIIKNPQKMLEDVFNNLDTNMEVDSNRLDIADAKKELDLMLGDQPAADTSEDKKTLLKIQEKKEVFPKKSKNNKKESKSKEPTLDEELMMGDAPAEEVRDEHSTTVSPKSESSTTDRQRRDVETTLASEGKVSTEVPSTTQHSEATTEQDSSSIPTDLITEPPQITSVVTEETTTKNIVQGHPMFHNHAVFKDPISVDNNNGSLERKDVSNSDDHFIPPMLLVKARFTATKSTEGTEETKEMTTDVLTSMATESTVEGQTVTETADDDKNATSKPTETNEISTNEISSVTQLETTPSIASEKPILVEKRNDPRVGLNAVAITTSTQSPSTTVAQMSSTADVQSPSTTEESTTVTEEASSSVSFESSVSEISTTESQTEESETSESSSSESPFTTKITDIPTSTQPEQTAERLIESTTQKSETWPSVASVSATPMAIKMTTLKAPETSTPKPINKSKSQMRNDIDEGHRKASDDSGESSHELHEHSDENGSYEHHHPENSLNNEDNFQPYKPNRHRSISKLDHHHGPAFSIGKILG